MFLCADCPCEYMLMLCIAYMNVALYHSCLMESWRVPPKYSANPHMISCSTCFCLPERYLLYCTLTIYRYLDITSCSIMEKTSSRDVNFAHCVYFVRTRWNDSWFRYCWHRLQTVYISCIHSKVTVPSQKHLCQYHMVSFWYSMSHILREKLHKQRNTLTIPAPKMSHEWSVCITHS